MSQLEGNALLRPLFHPVALFVGRKEDGGAFEVDDNLLASLSLPCDATVR